jgi:ATP synthase protein I
MKDDTRKLLRQLGMASTIGIQLVVAIFVGLAIGVWLDRRLGTFPWLALLFMIFGVAAGFVNYYRFAKKAQDED